MEKDKPLKPANELARDALRDKLKRKQQVMHQVRTNTCTDETIQQLNDMGPNLQMQVVNQLRSAKAKVNAKRMADTEAKIQNEVKQKNNSQTDTQTPSSQIKPKARPKRSSQSGKRRPPKPTQTSESITQSTEHTTKSIREARDQVLMAAIEKELANVIELTQQNQNGSMDASLAAQMQESAQRGFGYLAQLLHIPDLNTQINQQIQKWATSGAVPHQETVKKFLMSILDTYHKKQTPSRNQYTFHHDDPNPIPTIPTTSAPANATQSDVAGILPTTTQI